MIKEAQKIKKKNEVESKISESKERKIGQVSNSFELPLDEKEKFLSSYGFTLNGFAEEIKFSKNQKYAFRCNIYIEDHKGFSVVGTVYCLTIWNLESKCKEMFVMDNEENEIEEARVSWFSKFPECYTEIGNWKL